MKNCCRWIILVAAMVCVLSHVTAGERAASPDKVFEAVRDAQAKADWRALFHCQTPEARNEVVYEAYFLCNLHLRDAGVSKILTKHGVTSDAVDAEYDKQYERKHGVDLARLHAEYEAKQKKLVAEYLAKNGIDRAKNQLVPTPDFSEELGVLPPVDQKLFREVVMSRIEDKEAFYVEVNRQLVGADAMPRYGKLSDVVIRGDSATARTTTTIFHYAAGPGRPPMRVPTTIPQTVEFKRLNDAWYLHTIC